jgi:hypothetical protein
MSSRTRCPAGWKCQNMPCNHNNENQAVYEWFNENKGCIGKHSQNMIPCRFNYENKCENGDDCQYRHIGDKHPIMNCAYDNNCKFRGTTCNKLHAGESIKMTSALVLDIQNDTDSEASTRTATAPAPASAASAAPTAPDAPASPASARRAWGSDSDEEEEGKENIKSRTNDKGTYDQEHETIHASLSTRIDELEKNEQIIALNTAKKEKLMNSDHKKQIDRLNQQINQLNQQNETLSHQDDNIKLQQENDHLQQQNNDLQQENNHLQQYVDNYANENNNKDNEIKKLMGDIKSLMDENSTFKDKFINMLELQLLNTQKDVAIVHPENIKSEDQSNIRDLNVNGPQMVVGE